MPFKDSGQGLRTASSGFREFKSRMSNKQTPFVMLAVAVVVILIGPFLPPGLRSLVIEIMILCIFAMGYDILLGFTDQCSLGQSIFFGTGAYGVVLAISYLNANLWLALIIAVIASIVLAFLTGLIAVRLSEAYFVIITAIFFSIFYLLSLSMSWLTGGDDGISITVPSLSLGFTELSLYNPLVNYYFAFFFLIISYLILTRVVGSPLGKVFISIRENSERTKFLGYNVFRYKLIAFILAGLFAGLSGALYAIRLRYGSADFFSFDWSVLPIVWVLIGGTGTLIGPCIGVVIMSLFQYYVSAWWAQYLIIVGVLIIVILRVSPKGIVGYIRSRKGKVKEKG
ncbi:MAG: branched-chain amino acid ABC transporter permease [Dehalococcoidia bacterium]|nr:branched-chain amino acid ABC transporter permease [Dehalococcoidia bacterium]